MTRRRSASILGAIARTLLDAPGRPPPLPRTILVGLRVVAAGVLVLFWINRGLLDPHLTADGAAYWGSGDGVLYEYPWLAEQQGLPIPYVYSPAFAQLIWPLTQLDLPTFMAVWVAMQLLLLAWLAGPILGALLLLWPSMALTNVWAGSLYIPAAAMLAISLRLPAAWSFQFLTKVTPGVGVLWHAARGERRAFLEAIGVTAAIVGVSFVLWPDAWFDWIDLLIDSAAVTPQGVLAIPLALRVVLAAVLVVTGARLNWVWLLPVGVMLAMPQVGWSTTAVLLAIVRWWRFPSMANPVHARLDIGATNPGPTGRAETDSQVGAYVRYATSWMLAPVLRTGATPDQTRAIGANPRARASER